MSRFRGGGKWRSDSPARSNTVSSIRGKISAPIPIPDDDEFPIRTPGTGIATPLGMDATGNRLRISTAAPEYDNTASQTGIAISDFRDSTVATEPPAQITTQPPSEGAVRQTNQSTPLRNSVVSVPSGSSLGKPQRKKSSLRTVFGRLFGRKVKNGGSTSPPDQGSSEIRAGLHRSDPTALGRSPTDNSLNQKRSASLPINEYNRALRSHSLATEEFPIDNDGNDITYEPLQADVPKRPRRATTPSKIWTPMKMPGYQDWTGLSPRPASSHARDSKVISDTEATTANIGIGIAVTSANPNRRSRSLSELPETAAAQSIARRRSDEIRYWRESYEPGPLSPISSNKPEGEEAILINEVETPREEPQEQPQPFHFGPLSEMAGMKITQAASLEIRVQRLEARMLKMERLLYKDSHVPSAEPLHILDPASGNDLEFSIPQSSANTSEMSLPRDQKHSDVHSRQHVPESRPQGSQKRSSSHGSSRPSTMSTHISYHPSFDTFSPSTLQTAERVVSSSQGNTRPLSTSTTIRGIPSSSPTLPKDATLTGEHYTALTNMILAEQDKRQKLDAVVQQLQQQLKNFLTSATNPGVDQSANTLNESGKGGGEFSSFEQDDSSEDEDRYINEDLRAPNEERGVFGDEIFGSGVMSTSENTKSAPRTLSLSQITLGKGTQPNLNF